MVLKPAARNGSDALPARTARRSTSLPGTDPQGSATAPQGGVASLLLAAESSFHNQTHLPYYSEALSDHSVLGKRLSSARPGGPCAAKGSRARGGGPSGSQAASLPRGRVWCLLWQQLLEVGPCIRPQTVLHGTHPAPDNLDQTPPTLGAAKAVSIPPSRKGRL